MGYILHCFSCFHRETVLGITNPLKQNCPVCGAKLSTAGPLGLGQIADKKFCKIIEKEAVDNFREKKKLQKILSLVQNEAKAPATYYAVDKICDKLNLPVPPQKKVLDKLRKEGFQAVLTHFKSRGFRTDAPSDTIKMIITDLATNR
jgi:tRNA (guanine26-N2/guanine27-N2)-dimethyltransferase